MFFLSIRFFIISLLYFTSFKPNKYQNFDINTFFKLMPVKSKIYLIVVYNYIALYFIVLKIRNCAQLEQHYCVYGKTGLISTDRLIIFIDIIMVSKKFLSSHIIIYVVIFKLIWLYDFVRTIKYCYEAQDSEQQATYFCSNHYLLSSFVIINNKKVFILHVFNILQYLIHTIL